jgi:hyperosmotically inducible protein
MKEVRHQLVTQSYYSVFDNLGYRADGGTVTLFGQVTQPVLKNDAEKSVKSIEGVTSVNNQSEVLPLSASDDHLRRALFRAIYLKPGLERDALSAVPPIHIIVKNGNVTRRAPWALKWIRTLRESPPMAWRASLA